MQFFTRFALNRGRNLAAQAAFALGAALTVAESSPAEAQAPSEVGVWINHEGKGAVEIKPCGQALCGNIVWLREPLNDQGQPLFDRRNPDETKRNRPICGLPVIGNVRRTEDGWDEGWIYNPEEGAQYDVAIRAAGDRLTVTGYKGVKLFSKTFTWTRAPADLQRCDGAPPSQTKAKPAVTPPKMAAPKPEGAVPARKQPPLAGAAPAKAPTADAAVKKAVAKPAATDAATAAKKAPAKPAAASVGTAKVAKTDAKKAPAGDVKKAATSPAAKKPAATAAAGQPAPAKKTAATTAAPAKTATTAKPGAAPVPKPVAAKRPDGAATTAATDKKPAAKPAAKKQPADEADASSAEVD